MKKVFAIFLFAILTFSVISIALAAPQQPSGPGDNAMSPPGQGNVSKPMKEMLQQFFTEKEQFIEQKRQCKEEAVRTNAEKGTCWTKLQPVMLGLLNKELMLTRQRLEQLRNQSIQINNIEDIRAKLEAAKAVFEDSASTKEEIKAQAKIVEQIILDIEDQATIKEPEVLIKQMGDIIKKANALAAKLDIKIADLKATGYDTSEFETMLADFKEDVKDAEDKVDEAKATYDANKSAEDLTKIVKEIRTMITDAESSLEKAIDKAKALNQNMNQGGTQ